MQLAAAAFGADAAGEAAAATTPVEPLWIGLFPAKAELFKEAPVGLAEGLELELVPGLLAGEFSVDLRE
eukprot:4425588-Pleurochrysis_carterae.AAC.1